MCNIVKALVLALFVAHAASAVTLSSVDAIDSGHFGWSSTTCGDLTAVGEPGRSKVTVFYTETGVFVQSFGSPTGETIAGFGMVVKFSEDCVSLLVTAPFSDVCGSIDEGAGFTFDWGQVSETYQHVETHCGTNTGSGSELGRAGDINEDGSIVVLGAYQDDVAYAYVRGTPWTTAPVDDFVVQTGEYAGFCVAVSGDTVLVTSPLRFDFVDGELSFGAARLFRKDEGGTNNFGGIAAKVLVKSSNRLGYGCDMSGPDFALGDPLYGANEVTNPGSGQGRGVVYQYHLANNGAFFLEGVAWPADEVDPQDDQEFGAHVSMEHGLMQVGSPYYDDDSLVDTGYSTGLFRDLSGWDFDFGLHVSPGVDGDRFGWGGGVANGRGVGSSPWVDDVSHTDSGRARVGTFLGVFADGFESNDLLHWSNQ